MAYNKTNWVNGQAPALSAENLNKMENGIYDNDAHITAIQADIATLLADITALQAKDVSDKLTVNSAWSSVTKVAYRFGNLVAFTVNGLVYTFVANNEYTLVTLDSSITPKASNFFLGARTDANYNLVGFEMVRVKTNGTITVNASSTTGPYWFVSGWFVI